MTGSIVAATRELYQWREVLWMITYRDIRIKYKQSLMGFMWALLMPLLITAAGVLVKYSFAVVSGDTFDPASAGSVVLKSVPYAFFVASIRFSSASLVSNANLVTKIYFPREIFPVASILSQLFDFLIASVVLVAVLAIAGVGWSPTLVWVPVLVVILIGLALGIGIILSAANLFLRDVKYLVEVFLMFAIFVTPVFYEVDMFGKWAPLLMLNPVAPVLEGLNECVVLGRTPDLGWTLYAALFALFSLTAGVALFKKLEPAFAESI